MNATKPLEARQIEARSRARNLGIRIAVVSHARHYVTISPTTTGRPYDLTRTRHGWACTCLGYAHTGICKHLGQLERRAERENWEFGRVAPRYPLTSTAVIAYTPSYQRTGAIAEGGEEGRQP